MTPPNRLAGRRAPIPSAWAAGDNPGLGKCRSLRTAVRDGMNSGMAEGHPVTNSIPGGTSPKVLGPSDRLPSKPQLMFELAQRARV
jgi:hypothetical protein